MTRRRTRRTRSRRRSTTSPRAGRWTGSSAATSASARPRWRCAPPSPRRSTGSRPRSSCRRRCSPASTREIFRERFAGLPVKIGQLSRMVGAAEQRETKKALAEGGVDIVVGTHAVLGKTVQLQGPRPRRCRRGAAFRRRPQGAAEGPARRGAHADAVGDADPAHAAARHDRRARDVDHRDAAGRPARGQDLRLAVRRADRARGAAARALSRRPVVLCLPAHRGPGRGGGVPAPERAGGEIRHRARPDGRDASSRTRSAPSTTASTTFCCRPRSSNPASTFRAPTR